MSEMVRSGHGHEGGRPTPPTPPPPSPTGPVCEVCGTVMFERHCKILCPRCGYQRDCSDP